MNRISRRAAAEAAEALLEVGRTQPNLHYDVELGLTRHRDRLRSEMPMPEWASAGLDLDGAAKSLLAVSTKTIFSVLLLGVLAGAVWQVRARLQPIAAELQPALPAEVRSAAPSIPDVSTLEAESGPKPLPVPELNLPREQPLHRAYRADVPDKRAARVPRVHKGPTSARAPSPSARTESSDATATQVVEPTAVASTAPSEHVRPTGAEVAAASERDPNSAAPKARPKAGQAQAPDDMVEMQQVASAEQLLERSPARALALVRQGDQRFASGYFQQERAYIAIMALIRLDRIDEARAKAASFAKQFPALPYGARIRSALEARQGAASPAAAP